MTHIRPSTERFYRTSTDDINSVSSGISAIIGSSDSEPEQIVFDLNHIQLDQPVALSKLLTEQTEQTDPPEFGVSEEHLLNSFDSEPEQVEFVLGEA